MYSNKIKVIKITDFRSFNFSDEPIDIILGNFDGIHIGHIQLINFGVQNSKNKVAILTFLNSFKNDKDACLTSFEDKIEYFEKLGINYVFTLDFNDYIKNTEYIDFIELFLKKLNIKNIYCGEDFKFGKEAKGDVNTLSSFYKDTHILNFVLDKNGNKISSCNIKKYIKNGDIINANNDLGYEYHIKGKIIIGKKIGRTLGFPTANIKLNFNYCLPNNGVYVTKIEINNVIYKSITNIGISPTIKNDNIITIETYIFDFNKDIYGEEVILYFVDKLRNEMKFNSIDELKDKIKNDIEKANTYFR